MLKFKSKPGLPQTRFGQRETGSIVVFSLLILVAMLVVAGVGVDVARYESERVARQGAVDRAALAAASLTQAANPDAVIDSYLATSGFERLAYQSSVVTTAVGRSVSITSDEPIQTIFMGMVGVDDLPMEVVSSATEQGSILEVSLVLDISGSMRSGNRLAAMRDAAEGFVIDAFQQHDANKLSISLVPFAENVNLPPTMFDALNVVREHEYSSCIEPSRVNYAQTGFPQNRPLVQLPFIDVNGFERRSYPLRPAPSCPSDASYNLVPWSNDEQALRTAIQGLQTKEWTNIAFGMKWGLAMLSDDMNYLLDSVVPPAEQTWLSASMPMPFDHPDARKTIILLSDGTSTRFNELRPRYRNGASNVYHENGSYFVRRQRQGPAGESYRNIDTLEWTDNIGGQRLGWLEFWRAYPVYMYAQAMTSTEEEAWTLSLEIVDESRRNVIMPEQHRICDLARQAGVTVYAIGYTLGAGRAENDLIYCASSPSHYFRTGTEGLADVFSQILASMQPLRLVQ